MKRNLALMLAAFLFSCILLSIPLSLYAFELSDLGATKWKYYAGVPEHQELEADSTGYGNLCPKYSTLQCLEILYNAWYGLKSDTTSTLLDLDIRYFATGSIESVLGRLLYSENDSSACSKQNLNTFPNYDHAFYRINSSERLWDGWPPYYSSSNLTTLQNTLDKTPVIIRIKNYDQIKDEVQSTSYHGGIIPMPSTGSDWHYVVAVNYGTNGDTTFVECMNSFGVGAGEGTYIPNGFGDFFRVSTDNFSYW